MTLVELHIPDFNEAKEFYEKLGFVVVWERKPEEFKGYLVMEMENNILCFWAGNEKVYKHPYFKQLAIAAPNSRLGLGPSPEPSGAGSSVCSCPISPKSTKN